MEITNRGHARRGLVAVLTMLAVLCPAIGARAAAPTDIAIHVTATSFRVGVDASYNVTVSNVGDTNTDAPVRVTGTLPVGVTFVAGDGAGFTCSGAGRSVACSSDGIAAATTITLNLIVDVCTTASSIVTTLSVAYEGDINSSNDTAQRATSVKAGQCSARALTPTPPGGPTRTPTGAASPPPSSTPTPMATDLALFTASAGAFTIGTQPAYVHTVTNIGTSATNVPMTIVDTLPIGINLVTAAGDGWVCSASGHTVTCTNPNPLTVAATASLTLTVSVGSDAYPSVTNSTVLLYPAEVDPSDNTTRRPTSIRRPRPVRVRPGRPTPTPTTGAPGGTPVTPTRTPTKTPSPRQAIPTDLALTKTSKGVFTVGGLAFYVLKVTNIGRFGTDAPITLTDTVPASLSILGASGGGWTCTVTGQVLTCTRADPLEPGALAMVNLTVRASADAFPTVVNVATVSYANDTDTSNNTVRRPTTVRR